jgi:hypothetical protein
MSAVKDLLGVVVSFGRIALKLLMTCMSSLPFLFKAELMLYLQLLLSVARDNGTANELR